MDIFAAIAQIEEKKRADIFEVVPEPVQEVTIPLPEATGEKTQFSLLYSKEELVQKLAEERAKYAPFLQDLAPECPSMKTRTYLKEFVLDGTETVTLPHYGGPTGYAKKTYETQFVMDEVRADKTYNVCFTGVDYIATVYVNGLCVGKHEGFFSPFQFDISAAVVVGSNSLKIEVENDFNYMGNNENPVVGHGDKLYAATGLGWDDPALGWHHCPPGMGIYGKVWVEECSRVYISDIFVRPLPEEGKAEFWVDVYNSDYELLEPKLSISVYGQNFPAVIMENKLFTTRVNDFESGYFVCEEGQECKFQLPLLKGSNVYKVLVDIPDDHRWTLDTPYLYQVQAEVLLDGVVCDRAKRQFGMRSFHQDTVSEKKGMFYLNGKKIRLRGANTMGFEQWDVLREDFDQLIDDILYAKICNMNFLRLTQRPVQDEVYEYCDKLGLMTQTDLPLFGVMRRTKYAEGLRQAEEMEKLIRSHPCNVLVSLINEPTAHGQKHPHRHMSRPELEDFFKGCEYIIKLNNPDRVIKNVDGDYDPPCEGMPDKHIYNLWYNAHGVDVGKMIKGYFPPVKPNWYYGCGEFGVEGLDFPEVMRECYPKEWLKEPFDPINIVKAQTGSFYETFFPRPYTLEEWVERSQRHQEESIKIMTEAFRRDNNVASIAIHLFIDAWPSGWMKTIMDCRRNPKPAYFSYMHALEPVMLSLRTDRFTYYAGEQIKPEVYLCNDTNDAADYEVLFELTDENGRLLRRTSVHAVSEPMQSKYIGSPTYTAQDVEDREKVTLTAFLKKDGKILTCNSVELEVFARQEEVAQREDVVWINDLPEGEHEIAGEKIKVIVCPMRPKHFCAMARGHAVNEHFEAFDFRYWYNENEDMITPILHKIFFCDGGFTPVLLGSGRTWNDRGGDGPVKMAVAEKEYQGKKYIINMVDLRKENPVAQRFIDFMNR